MMIWRITADYRPNNKNKPIYHLHADSKKEAKQKFERCFPWLKVYEVVEEHDYVKPTATLDGGNYD